MILTEEILEQIVATIDEDRTVPVVLPDHAYGANGRVIILDDGIPTDLHRHLHNVLIRPLGFHERMWQPEGCDPRNVNPYIMHVVAGYKTPATHCQYGHEYEGNEAPPNSRGYRCLTCLKNSRPAAGTGNRDKTHCPANHPYTEENTYHTSDGRRRCLICKRDQNREYARARRAEQKEQS